MCLIGKLWYKQFILDIVVSHCTHIFHLINFVLALTTLFIFTGESGLGKSTLINSLFLSDLYSGDYPGPSHRIQKTVKVDVTMVTCLSLQLYQYLSNYISQYKLFLLGILPMADISFFVPLVLGIRSISFTYVCLSVFGDHSIT